MEPEEYADNFLAFEDSLKSLLRRNVDLVSNKAIRNPVFRANVDRHKHLLYE
jgi:predicted nucleotidyltransferase